MDDLLANAPETALAWPESPPPRPGLAPARDAARGARPLERGLRVLMISEACGGGAGRHLMDLSEGLIERGCEVHLISSPYRMDSLFQQRLEQARSIRHVSLPIAHGIGPNDFASLVQVRRYLRRFGPFDIVHGHASKGGALARLAAAGSRARVLYTLHGFIAMDPGVSRRKRLFYQAIEWTLSKLTDRIVSVAPEEHRACLSRGLGRSRVILIPNGVDPIAFGSRFETRRALGLPGELPIVGFIGRLVEQKAPDVLIRAFAEAVRVLPEALLAIVGTGPLEASVRRLADELEIGSRVRWLGERPGTMVLPAFDLLALSSRKEGLPYVLLEAMAAGLPIVATRPAGVELLVDHGQNGLVVAPDDPGAMASALVALLSDPALRQRQGRASLERAAQFTAQAMVDRTLAAYMSCLSLSPSRARGSDRAKAISTSPPLKIASNPHSDHPRGDEPMAAKPRSAELHPGPGFRVRTEIPRLDPMLMEQFRKFATPDISDLLNRLYAVNPAIQCLTSPEHVLCGPACTVKVFPGDNLMVHKALDVAQPGDIVVVDSGGSTSNAVLGDLISTKAKHRKIAGFIIDGLVRDLPSILPLDFPVFARGTTPIGPLHRGPGEINFPICCGGIVVNPGDLIVADAAGVIVVPREIAAELLDRLNQHHDSNVAYLESVQRGDFSNQWVDRLLEAQGCPMVVGSDDEDEALLAAGGNRDTWLSAELPDAFDPTPAATPQA